MKRLVACLLLMGISSSIKAQLYQVPDRNEQQLLRSCQPILTLSEKELLNLVPVQSGFRFSASPESQEGAQENNFIWKPEFGDKVQCQFTKTFFPNETYPENGYVDVETPSGKIQRYLFHEDDQGNRYWYQARRWFEQRIFLERGAYQLAQLYHLDPKRYFKAGHYSRLILTRFAQVYPDYIVTFEYPSQPKKFISHKSYPEEVERMGENAWRLAKWTWWAYADVSESLLLAYDLLRSTHLFSTDEKNLVENQLFRAMLNYVDRYSNLSLTNMHPTLWRAQAVAANLFELPNLIELVNRGISQMLNNEFTQDGFWKETTVSYHRQTAFGLQNVFNKLYPSLTEEEKTQKMKEVHPTLSKAIEADYAFRLPNGHFASINDTWFYDQYQPPLAKSTPQLLTGTGYAVLGMGSGVNQLQAHLNYNGHFGHDHFGALNLTLFAKGKEMLSDIGYTHTIARTWATSSTAHNLVVVNGKSQRGRDVPYSGRGNLRLYNVQDPTFQVVESEATHVYEDENITDYRRTLISVGINENDHYIVDFFTANGNARKDWIIHGSADENQDLILEDGQGRALKLKTIPSLIPVGLTFRELSGLVDMRLLREPFWGHSNFKNVRQASNIETFKATFRYKNEPDLGLQSWFPTHSQTPVHMAEAWSVRNTRENQGKLDDYLRPALILTDSSEYSRFCAVHVPFKSAIPVSKVSSVIEDETVSVLKIETASGRTDYLIFQSENGQNLLIKLDKKPLKFDGRVALISVQDEHVTLKMVEGSTLSWGNFTINHPNPSTELLEIKDNQLVVAGNMNLQQGEVVIVEHRNGATSAFQIEAIKQENGRTILATFEPSIYQLTQNGALTMSAFPFFNYPGPHRVKSSFLTVKSFPK